VNICVIDLTIARLMIKLMIIACIIYETDKKGYSTRVRMASCRQIYWHLSPCLRVEVPIKTVKPELMAPTG